VDSQRIEMTGSWRTAFTISIGLGVQLSGRVSASRFLFAIRRRAYDHENLVEACPRERHRRSCINGVRHFPTPIVNYAPSAFQIFG